MQMAGRGRRKTNAYWRICGHEMMLTGE
jgi:hypothetical protein